MTAPRNCLSALLSRIGPWRVLAGLLLVVSACSSPDADEPAPENALSLDVDTVLTDTTYTLVNQDRSAVQVPDDFLGTPVLVGSIFTNCANVCPQITANMKEVREQLDDPNAVQFVSVTFDPRRDTPDRLAAYREKFNLEDTSWQFLTGEPEALTGFLGPLDVTWRVKGTNRQFPADTTDDYIYKHSNQITLIDAKGRVRAEYGGSQTPPSLILGDLAEIQS